MQPTSTSAVSLPRPVDVLRWDDALTRMAWHPGEHVTSVGPTGRGKTELLIALMRARTWTTFLGTKRKDSTQDVLEDEGYRVIRDPSEINPEVHHRFFLRPPFPRRATAAQISAVQKPAFSRALMRLREQMGWTIGIDETHYLTDFLGLGPELELLWRQGRSESTTIIANTQRPRHIPLVAYSQATHLFFWSSPDLSDVRRIGEMVPIPLQEITRVLAGQDKHTVLYANTVTGDMFQTNTRW